MSVSTSTPKAEPRMRIVTTEVNDMVIVNDSDLGHGRKPTSRPKDATDLRNGSTTPAATHRRRLSSSKPRPPKWKTILSILTKWCLLLVGIMWLGQMILKLSNNGNVGNYPFSAMESEGRIAEIESLLKKTSKMFQIQIDAVDKKIESEIGGAVKELRKDIEEKDGIWEKELKRLEGITSELGKSVGQLKEMGFLSKEEFESFKDELKKRGGNVDLDEIRHLAKEIVVKEIEKHAADGIGRVDYALASSGGRVIMHSQPFVSGKVSNWFFAGKDRYRVHSNAKKMIEPSFGEPGQCFALQGSSGFVEIRLRAAIIPQAVTLEHVFKSVAYDRSSAPKDCIVSAWLEGSDEPAHSQVLTKFTYDLEKSNAQTFDVEATDTIGVVNVVRLEFTSNHGNPSLTCIYRFRVHGYEDNTPKVADSNSLAEVEGITL